MKNSEKDLRIILREEADCSKVQGHLFSTVSFVFSVDLKTYITAFSGDLRLIKVLFLGNHIKNVDVIPVLDIQLSRVAKL